MLLPNVVDEWDAQAKRRSRDRGASFDTMRCAEAASNSRAYSPHWKGIDNGLSGTSSNVVTADSILLLGIRSGNEQAMGELYERYSGIVYSVALRVLGDSSTAEDILQEVFLKLWRTPEVFDGNRGSLGGWLAVIARNRAIDFLRQRRPESDIEDVVVGVEPDMVRDADWRRTLEKIRASLVDMPASQRSALEMAFFEGLTHTEIAEKTGEHLGTIKTRIRAGLKVLRKALNR
jgi:RNA polymerase sigma-70 factor, ECF subfamily